MEVCKNHHISHTMTKLNCSTTTRWWFETCFYFHPYLGKIPILTKFVQWGWFKHQLDNHSNHSLNDVMHPSMICTEVARDLESFAFVLEVPGVDDTSSFLGSNRQRATNRGGCSVGLGHTSFDCLYTSQPVCCLFYMLLPRGFNNG